jgi:hypothetical protein
MKLSVSMILSCYDVCEDAKGVWTHCLDVCMNKSEVMHVLHTVKYLFKLETPILRVIAEFYEVVRVTASTHIFDLTLCRMQSAE